MLSAFSPMPRVTWMLPVKNGMPYIAEALESIATQTSQNFEVLAWDNGSIDGTLAELQRWIPTRLRGRIVADRPLPLGLCRAEMVRQSRTEYCACADADDISEPTRLDKQVAFLDQHPSVALVGSQLRCINAAGETREVISLPTKHSDIMAKMLIKNGIGQPSVLFRRQAVLDAGNYREMPLADVEDYDLWLRVAAHGQLANLAEALVRYRVHDRSTTQKALREERLHLAMQDVLMQSARDCFGVSASDLLRWRGKKLLFNLPTALNAARSIARQSGTGLKNVLVSTAFVSVWREFTSAKDFCARVTMAYLATGASGAARECLGIVRHVLRYLLGGLFLGQWTSHWQSKTTHWVRSQQKQQTNIHPSIALTGNPEFAPYIHLEKFCLIERDATIWISEDAGAEPNLALGERVFVGRNTYLGVYQPITVGANTLIGAYSYIISGNHRADTRDIPIRDQGYIGAAIHIGDDVWIGTHVIILPGVQIGRGAIIGASSVVTQNVGEYEIWAGTPARLIKQRP